MGLKVKAGREYVLGGKVYKDGDAVEGVPDKYARILTAPKGPLEYDTRVIVPSDLPAAAMKPAPTVEEADAPAETSETVAPLTTEALPVEAPARPRKGRSHRRDMRAKK